MRIIGQDTRRTLHKVGKYLYPSLSPTMPPTIGSVGMAEFSTVFLQEHFSNLYKNVPAGTFLVMAKSEKCSRRNIRAGHSKVSSSGRPLPPEALMDPRSEECSCRNTPMNTCAQYRDKPACSAAVEKHRDGLLQSLSKCSCRNIIALYHSQLR